MRDGIIFIRDGQTLPETPKATCAINDKIKSLIRNNESETPDVKDGFPAILKCKWCGEKSREIYIPQLKDGKDGKPCEIVYDYAVCDACKKKWADIVVIFEITEEEPYPDCLPIDSTTREVEVAPGEEEEVTVHFYPTSRCIGVTEEVANETIIDAKKGMIFYMEDRDFEYFYGEVFRDEQK